MEWVLVIYIYAGMLARGDSVAVTTVPMSSEEICNEEAKKLDDLVSGSSKNVRYVCLRNR